MPVKENVACAHKPGWGICLLPTWLFSFVALVDLLLQHVGVWNEWGILKYAWQALGFGAFFGSLSFFLGNGSRWVLVPLWCWWCGVLVVESISRIGFGLILDGDWVMILATSSLEELGEFLCRVPWGLSAGLIVLSAVLAWSGAWVLRQRIYSPVSWRGFAIGAICLLPIIGVMTDFSHAPSVGSFMRLISIYLPFDTLYHGRVYADTARMVAKPELPPGLRRLVPAAQQLPLGVVVVGESATRANWGLYGYARPTTPCLKALEDELLIFSRATATHPLTGQSLRMVFTEATVEEPEVTRCTFAQKCSAVGYTCRLLSNQARWGRWEGMETMLFAGCAEKWYAAEQPAVDEGERRYDNVLLPAFEQRCGNAETNVLPEMVFLHLMGSHADPADRYPPMRAVYPRYEGDLPPDCDERSSDWNKVATDIYDNSIVYTDALLGDLLERLSQIRRPAFFVYFSDHGETPRARYWRTESHPDMFAVPLIVWLSPAYRKTFPGVEAKLRRCLDEPIRLDHLQTILMPLARIGQ